MQNQTSTLECFTARPQSDSEIAAKFAVLFQARRNKLELREGEEDTMEVLSWEAVQDIMKELEQLFMARPDQRLRKQDDEQRWRNRQLRGNMQSPTKRAKGRFDAMIHQLFQVEVVDIPGAAENVGAQSPDYTIKPIEGGVVARNILTYGLMDWRELSRIHTVYAEESERRARDREARLNTPEQRLRGDAFSGGMAAVQHRRHMHMVWKDGMRAATWLGLGPQIAESHSWLYVPDQAYPGALPPEGVRGTTLEGRCCGFIWPKMVHGAPSDDLKYCALCYALDRVRRPLCPGCRDNRRRANPDEALCAPGFCPAHERRYNADWHAAEHNRPWWFAQWAYRHPNFEQWPVPWRIAVLEEWHPGFIRGRQTQQLEAAQRVSRAGVDPTRRSPTILPDDTSISSRVMRERPAR